MTNTPQTPDYKSLLDEAVSIMHSINRACKGWILSNEATAWLSKHIKFKQNKEVESVAKAIWLADEMRDAGSWEDLKSQNDEPFGNQQPYFDMALAAISALPTNTVTGDEVFTPSCGCVFKDLDVPCKDKDCKICPTTACDRNSVIEEVMKMLSNGWATRQQISLRAGEMTAAEWRTASAVSGGIMSDISALKSCQQTSEGKSS